MFERILVPLDGSRLAECVLPHTVAMARSFGARVTLLRVLERDHSGELPALNALDWQFRKAEGEARLKELAARLYKVGLQTEHKLVEGRAAEQILAFARQNGTDLIILSSHGRSGLSGWNVSSVVQKIIIRACMSIMIVRAYQPRVSDLTGLSYKRLLLPLDGSQRAEHILPAAIQLTRSHGSQLLLVHVVRKPEMPRRRPLTEEETKLINKIIEMNHQEADRYLEELRTSLSAEQVDVQTRLLVSDNAVDTLHDLVEQEDIDLVILSAHGDTGGTKRPYGSLAVNFIAYGTTPLLIVQDLTPEELEPSKVEILVGEHRGH